MGCTGKTICSGELRHVVSVQENPRPDDGYGGYNNDSDDWVEKFKIYCKIEEKSGEEKFAHQRVETRSKVVFTTRYRSDILPTDRLVLEGVAHNIREINDLMRQKRWLEITAEEGVVD